MIFSWKIFLTYFLKDWHKNFLTPFNNFMLAMILQKILIKRVLLFLIFHSRFFCDLFLISPSILILLSRLVNLWD